MSFPGADSVTAEDISPSSSTLTITGAGPTWPEQDEQLRTMWLQMIPPEKIAEALGRTEQAVQTRASRLGLERRARPGRKPGARRMITGEDGTISRPPATPRQPVAASADSPAVQPSQRICLMCLKSFMSQGRHNRICLPCKGSSEYSQAGALPEIHLNVTS